MGRVLGALEAFTLGGGAPEGRELSTFEQGPSGYLEGTARDGGR